MTLQESLAAAAQDYKKSEFLADLMDKAIQDADVKCQAILQEHPNQPDALHLLGVISFRRQRFDEAVKYFRLAVIFANDSLLFHQAYGQSLYTLGRIDEAAEAFRNATICLPKEGLPHKWLSDLYKRNKQMKEASESYGRWIELNPAARANDQKVSFGARERRKEEGFFDKYCQGYGIDIGWGGDLLGDNCVGWDFEDGDAELMAGVPDQSYDFVYSSHNLEHLWDVDRALVNWWRLVKPGGYLILYLPHRDLCECRRYLPSSEPDHRHYFMPEEDDLPDTIGVRPLLRRLLPDGELLYVETYGQQEPTRILYSIEAVVRKPLV